MIRIIVHKLFLPHHHCLLVTLAAVAVVAFHVFLHCMKIGIDVLGGDFASEANLKGNVLTKNEHQVKPQ